MKQSFLKRILCNRYNPGAIILKHNSGLLPVLSHQPWLNIWKIPSPEGRVLSQAPADRRNKSLYEEHKKK